MLSPSVFTFFRCFPCTVSSTIIFPTSNIPGTRPGSFSSPFSVGALFPPRGWKVLRERFNRPSLDPDRYAVSAAGLILLVTLWDYHPQKKIGLSLLDEGNPIYQALRRMPPGEQLVLGLPMFPGDSHQSSLYEYYITQSGVRMVNGYSPVVARRYVEKVFWPLIGLNVGEIPRRRL